MNDRHSKKSSAILIYFLIFLVLNFGALGLGGFFTGQGVTSEWYASANKAPWTPPGWVFGAAWTMIMLCYSIYMAFHMNRVEHRRKLIGLFLFQWVLNVGWNPVFFYFHNALISLIIISVLTCVIGLFLLRYVSVSRTITLLIVPYFLWLIIATSLNAYIFLYN